MNKNLTKKFVDTDLKQFSENLFVERQISLLPDTQNEAMKWKRIYEITDKITEANSELNRIKKILHDQKEIIRSYNLEILRLRNGTSTSETTSNFTMKCPSEDCNGFLDSKYFCTLCDTKFCKHCMEIKKEDHVCNEDTKATIQAIKKESKPCPGCGEMISKIDGCDQMWCVKCHIQFSWRTGVQITGYNHNPEYFRWMRETGQHINRNPQAQAAANRQVMCGIALDDYTITRIASNVFHNDKNTVYRFQLLYRFYRHVEYKLTRAILEENNETELRNLRVKYLLGEITKPQWKRTLQQIDKKTKKTTVYNNIWRLIQTVMTSFMEQIITCSNENASPVEYLKIIEEAINFKVYANDSFCKACSVFGSTSCPGIDDSWREIYNYKKYLKNKNKS
jgi:hypothetical protein|tara:strand:- start:11346 stop:12527 length:1182 start_codon:yes stop_codon:yes gene_type:complete